MSWYGWWAVLDEALVVRPGREDGRRIKVAACEDGEYKEATLGPPRGSAIFWENMYSNSMPYRGSPRATTCETGTTIGLNIWS